MAQRSSRRPSGTEKSQPRSEYWRGQSAAWVRSGLTQADFCAEHELSLSALRWWRWKLKREDERSTSTALSKTSDGSMRLVPVRVVDPQARSSTPLSCTAPGGPSSAFEVLLKSGTTIRVPGDFEAEALSAQRQSHHSTDDN